MGSENSHYFDDDPASPSAPRQVELVLPDLTTTLASDSGVFSSETVDPGTRSLLLGVPDPLPTVKTALDLGCGYAPIARTLCHRAPRARVWAVDVNERALDLARTNLAGLNATITRPDEVPDHVRFDLIWSNPPIRIGKSPLHELLETWLDRMAPDGQAFLVVHKHLGADSLASWLGDNGWPTTRVRSRNGYRLLRLTARTAEEPQ
ncbi:MAG: class I SAM-dependent methyltransferase [Acidimicrobiales bacterium]